MIERARVLQNPINVFFAQTQGLSKADKKVESLRLTDADWETLQAVKTFLSPFAKVSKAAEGAAYPTVSMVVPYYNGLIDAMESCLAKGSSATLQLMLVAALGHLKKYAYMTSNEYWIATFLDPSIKAAWFADTYCEKLHPETDRRVRPRPASGEVIKLVRDRVAEYQARAAELAPRPTPLALVVEEEGDEVEDDDDAQFLPSRRRLAVRLSASQEAGGRSWYSSHPGQRIGEGRRPRGVAPPEFAIEGEGLEEDEEEEEEEEEGVKADAAAGPTSRHSFRYDGPRPPPSGQTQPESGSEEEDEEEEGEGAEDEDDEGSGDDNEAGWDLETHGGGEGGDDDEDHEMDGLEPEEVEEGVGEGGGGAATEAASQHVAEGGGSVGCKICTDRISWKQSTTTLDERHFESYHTAHMHVWHHRYHTPSVHLPWETFPHGGYNGVPDGYVDRWPHAKSWPHLAKKKGKASGGARGSGGMERFMTTKLSTVELRQAIAKLVVTCDLPFRIVEAEAVSVPCLLYEGDLAVCG
ncbi:unnamed protein product [Closterium sp. NIES-53]